MRLFLTTGPVGDTISRPGRRGAVALTRYLSRSFKTTMADMLLFDYQPAPVHLVQKAKVLKAVCDRHGVELRAAALQFPFGHEAVISAVPGAASVAELEDNARVMRAEIPPALWAELKAEGLLPEGAPTP